MKSLVLAHATAYQPWLSGSKQGRCSLAESVATQLCLYWTLVQNAVPFFLLVSYHPPPGALLAILSAVALLRGFPSRNSRAWAPSTVLPTGDVNIHVRTSLTLPRTARYDGLETQRAGVRVRVDRIIGGGSKCGVAFAAGDLSGCKTMMRTG